MTKFLSLAVLAAVAFASPAMAFDAKLTQTKSVVAAQGSGGAQSSSGAIGGSALIGGTQIVVGNSSAAVGSVTAKTSPGKSSVDQTYVSGSTTVLQSNSLGLAGNVGGAAGTAGVDGSGYAKTKVNSVKLHF